MEYIIGSDQATKTLTTKTVRLTGGFFVENSYTTETVNKELQVVPCVPNVNMKFKIMGELRAQLDEDDDARLIYPDRSKFHNALYENARDDIGKSLVVVLPMIIGGEKVVYNFYLKIDSVSLE